MADVHPELIKNLYKIRKYMREFYIFGFRSYDEYEWKSKETYYDERVRIANWLGENMVIPSAGNKVDKDHIAVESRSEHHNPLYNAWKSKAFTNGQLAIHFSILYAAAAHKGALVSKSEVHPENYFEDEFSDNSVGNQLKKYADMGFMTRIRSGRKYAYKLNEIESFDSWKRALDFFSEVAPCGAIGSFTLDKIKNDEKDIFSFKHNYMSSALDDEIMANIFAAIHQRQMITIEYSKHFNSETDKIKILPLKVLTGSSTGRSYVAAKDIDNGWMNSYRLDYITKISKTDPFEEYDKERREFEEREKYLWGVSFGDNYPETEKVSMTIKVPDEYCFVADRLEREKRNGMVTKLSDHTYRFDADVFDSIEVLPWIRSFMGFITELSFSNETVHERFKRDAERLIDTYGEQVSEK